MNKIKRSIVFKKGGFGSHVVKDMILLSPALISFFVSKFLTKILWGMYLPPEALGVLVLYLNTQSHISTVSTGWLRSAAIRFLPEDANCLAWFIRTSFLVIIVMALLGLLFCWLLKLTIFQSYSEFKWLYIILVVVLFVFSSLFLLFQVFLRGLFEQKRFSSSTIFQHSIRLLFLIVLLPFAQDYIAAVLVAVIFSYAGAVLWQYLGLSSHLRGLSLPQPPTENDTVFKKSLRYGLPLSVSMFLVNLSIGGDRYILAGLFSMHQLGVYSFWMAIGLQVVQGLNRLFFLAVNPRLFQAHGQTPEKAQRYAGIITNYYFLLALPASLILAIMIPAVFSLIHIKPAYLHYSHLLFFAVIMAFFMAMTQLSGKKSEFDIKMKVFVYAALAAIVMMIICVFSFSVLFGLYGAASGALLGSVTYFLIISTYSRGWPSIYSCLISIAASLVLLILYFRLAENIFVLFPCLALFYMLYLMFIWKMGWGGNFLGKRTG